MSYLDQSDADRIITAEEFKQAAPVISSKSMAIRCNYGITYKSGAGYNLNCYAYDTSRAYATALYASVCFSQDTIQGDMDAYNLLLMKNCATTSGETYNYTQGSDMYTTLPKCHGLGSSAELIYSMSMNDSAITLARRVVEYILALK
jgi:hypothetical protein